MQKRCVVAPNGPPAAGPYSHAVFAGPLLYISGQGALAKDGTLMKGTIETETRQTLTNIKAIVEDAGGSLNDIVKMNVFLTDMGDFSAMNGVYKEFFAGNYPARSTIQVAGLPLGFQVEIEAIALIQK